MGHLRLGDLPKTRHWDQLIALLDAQPDDVPQIAYATSIAAERRLRELANDPSLRYCFWLLTRLMIASRGNDFAGEAARLGLPIAASESVMSFIAGVSDAVRPELAQHVTSGPFSELASLALRRALAETVSAHTPSLFGSSVEDLQRAFRQQSTPRAFGAMARVFFGDYLARTLRYFIDKTLPARVGAGHALTGNQDAADFKQALDTYARQTARIMEDFAADWYSLHNWESRGRISQQESDGFVAHAMTKLRDEVRREAVRR